MAPDIPACFERDQGITESDWLRCLPGAVREHALTLPGPGEAEVRIGSGSLQLRWQVLPPRRIALMNVPRLGVSYRFDGVDTEARREFMRYFDLYTQRGGG